METSLPDAFADSELVSKGPCADCGSSDACALYTDGHSFCFSCRSHRGGYPTSEPRKPKMSHGLIEIGDFKAIQKRGLSEETCRRWGYSVGSYNGQTVHIATYRNTAGESVAQKVRFPNKEFVFLGDTKNCGLFGSHLWRDSGKRVVVTEGEIDALSVSQLQDHKWPVVSVPNGAQGAKKSIQRAIEWLEGFEEVVFLFDNDEHGQAASKECSLLLTPGKAKIGKLPLKDANDMLVAGRAKELIDAIWSAKVFRPDGIVNGQDLWEKLSDRTPIRSVPYPWSGLDSKLLGLRVAELVTFTAGSGIGKSQVCRELAYHLLKRGESVGYIALEESTTRTALGLMGIHANRPLHISKEGCTDEEFKAAYQATVGNGRCFLYDHFGSIDSESLLSRLRYLARGCGCQWIILDHISIVVSGIGDGDERRLIDNTMTMLRSLVQETGVGMILVSHLKRPEGGNRGHEEGAQVTLAQLRGSAAIAQLSDVVIGLERDQQDEESRHLTTVRVLKNRFSGDTGVATTLAYDTRTGRLHEGTVTPAMMASAGKDF